MSNFKIVNHKALAALVKDAGPDNEVSFAKCYDLDADGIVNPNSVENHYGAVLLNKMDVNFLLVSQNGSHGCYGIYSIDDYESIESALYVFFKNNGWNPDEICVDIQQHLSEQPNEQPKVEGSKVDTGFKGLGYVDKFCHHCGGITHNAPADRICLCVHCNAELPACIMSEGNGGLEEIVPCPANHPASQPIKVQTSFGVLVAEAGSDSHYPGIAIYLEVEGEEGMELRDLAMVEVMPDQPREGQRTLRTFVWNDFYNESYTHHFELGVMSEKCPCDEPCVAQGTGPCKPDYGL